MDFIKNILYMKNDTSGNFLTIYFSIIYLQKSNILNINIQIYKKNGFNHVVL